MLPHVTTTGSTGDKLGIPSNDMIVCEAGSSIGFCRSTAMQWPPALRRLVKAGLELQENDFFA